METKIPTQLLKPRLAREIPRSEYLAAPKLKSNDEKSRKSFITLLRKGPNDKTSSSSSSSVIKINCALWLSLSKPISSCVSLVIHTKEKNDDYCLILDETKPQDSESLMLSGSTTIQPNSDIEFMHVSYCGIPRDYHVRIDDLHIECEVLTKSEERKAFG